MLVPDAEMTVRQLLGPPDRCVLGELRQRPRGHRRERRRRNEAVRAARSLIRRSSRACRDVVTELVGLTADRTPHTMPFWRWRSRPSGSTERARHFSAADSARDPAARSDPTLAVTLTDELPTSARRQRHRATDIHDRGEQAELAWAFMQQNLAALACAAGTVIPHRLQCPTS